MKYTRSIGTLASDVELNSLQERKALIHRQWFGGSAKSKKICEHAGDSLHFDFTGTKEMESVNWKVSLRCRIQFSTTSTCAHPPAMEQSTSEIEKHSPPGGRV
ncbi:unnamed protein product [Rotaria magnacalcarata]|uniref:Uncharacterized protein n=1 Tax=Rotaria magnacalcarata TaxID=392030 RepID=A0A814KHP2_9BILA|nr:unnamed protein product [Rotaria magnacalcarata]CAF2102198.1 unnamed protein product [Rotaria magnacalcarata]CAF4572234.1 unnamed protein product [Rotaria magnacalcarata]CAF4815523.1 unnamed protein product [Rotaria magnacalcarata]